MVIAVSYFENLEFGWIEFFVFEKKRNVFWYVSFFFVVNIHSRKIVFKFWLKKNCRYFEPSVKATVYLIFKLTELSEGWISHFNILSRGIFFSFWDTKFFFSRIHAFTLSVQLSKNIGEKNQQDSVKYE